MIPYPAKPNIDVSSAMVEKVGKPCAWVQSMDLSGSPWSHNDLISIYQAFIADKLSFHEYERNYVTKLSLVLSGHNSAFLFPTWHD